MTEEKVANKESEAQKADTTANPVENSGPELTVQDLAAIKQIIDVASSRGAFKPNEMMTIGQVYTKLETFLNAVQPQQAQSQGD